ncbi:Ribonuclease III domain containing protein [Lactarius tabidus]
MARGTFPHVLPLSFFTTDQHTRPCSSLTLPTVITMLPPLPIIRSAQLLDQIFTHTSLNARPRNEFEASQDDPMCDNEGLAHIGGQVLGLAVTDLIQSRFPCLHVGPTSKVRDRVKCGGSLAEISVKYRLHERLRAEDPRLRGVQSVQVDVFKAYVGALFREQGVDVVKRWLNPLFEPLVDNGYRSERRFYLLPEPAAPATTSLTPPPSPPPQRVAPAPSLLGRAVDGLNEANVRGRGGPEQRNARNRPIQYHSLAAGAPPGVTDRPSGYSSRRGMALLDGGRGNVDVPGSSCARWNPGSPPRQRSPTTAELTESGGKRPRSK